MPNDPTQHDQLRSPESKADVARNIGVAESVAERTADPLSQTGWTVRVQGTDLVIVLAGDWIVRQTGVAASVAKYLLQNQTPRTLMFDATSLGHWDSALIVFLWDLQTEAARFEIEFDLSGLPEPARQLLALASVQVAPKAPPAAREELLDWTGRRAITYWSEVVEVAKLIGETMLRAWPALRGRGGLRRVDVVDSAWEAGIAAVPIVGFVAPPMDAPTLAGEPIKPPLAAFAGPGLAYQGFGEFNQRHWLSLWSDHLEREPAAFDPGGAR